MFAKKLGQLETVELTYGKRQRKEKKIFDPSDNIGPVKKSRHKSPSLAVKDDKKASNINQGLLLALKDDKKASNITQGLLLDSVKDDKKASNITQGLLLDSVKDDKKASNINQGLLLDSTSEKKETIKSSPSADEEIHTKECSVRIKRLSESQLTKLDNTRKNGFNDEAEHVVDLVNFFSEDSNGDSNGNFPRETTKIPEKYKYPCSKCFRGFPEENLLKLHMDSIHLWSTTKIRCPHCMVMMYGSGYEVHVINYHPQELLKKDYLKLFSVTENVLNKTILPKKVISSAPLSLPPARPLVTDTQSLVKTATFPQRQEIQTTIRPRIAEKKVKAVSVLSTSVLWEGVVGEPARNTRSLDLALVRRLRKAKKKEVYKYQDDEKSDSCLPLHSSPDYDHLKERLGFLKQLTHFSTSDAGNQYYREYLKLVKNVKAIKKFLEVSQTKKEGSTAVYFKKQLLTEETKLIVHCTSTPPEITPWTAANRDLSSKSNSFQAKDNRERGAKFRQKQSEILDTRKSSNISSSLLQKTNTVNQPNIGIGKLLDKSPLYSSDSSMPSFITVRRQSPPGLGLEPKMGSVVKKSVFVKPRQTSLLARNISPVRASQSQVTILKREKNTLEPEEKLENDPLEVDVDAIKKENVEEDEIVVQDLSTSHPIILMDTSVAFSCVDDDVAGDDVITMDSNLHDIIVTA